jgi:signal transduction histidine kinase
VGNGQLANERSKTGALQMKLLTKTTLYFLLFMIPLLAAGGYFLFSQFSREINERVDRELIYDELQWIQYLEAATANGSNFILRSPDLLIYPTERRPTRFPTISDTEGRKAKENVRISFRQLRHVVPINGIPYQITIRKSQEQKAALVGNITWIMLLVFLGLFIATLLFNWLISQQIWYPFRASLQKVRNLELEKMEAIHFEKTNITEFNELNSALNNMSQKIHRDYANMKEFTENAAHEMQTPLAVAQTKLELLLQDPSLQEKQIEAIAQASMALSRLSKLNQSLLLLAKIENNQYETAETISLTAHTKKYLHLFEEIIRDKDIKVSTVFEEDFAVRLHPFLADSLVSNLLGNSIKYNQQGGELRITVQQQSYCISNTSSLPSIPHQQLFQRFTASSHFSESSTGLGLAIVKRITDTHQLTIAYEHADKRHTFCISKKVSL